MSLADRARDARAEHLSDESTALEQADQVERERQAAEKAHMHDLLAAYVTVWADRLGAIASDLSDIEYVVAHNVRMPFRDREYTSHAVPTHLNATFYADELEFRAAIVRSMNAETAAWESRRRQTETYDDDGSWYLMHVSLAADNKQRHVGSLAALGEVIDDLR